MADTRHLIQVLLEAKDDTAAAFASAMGNIEGFKQAKKEQGRVEREHAEELQRLNDDVSKSEANLRNERNKGILQTKEAADAAYKLEKAALAHGKAQRDATKSDVEREKALRDLEAAENDFRQALEDQDETEKKLTETRKKAAVDRIRNGNVELGHRRHAVEVFEREAKKFMEAERAKTKTQQEESRKRERAAAEENRKLKALEADLERDRKKNAAERNARETKEANDKKQRDREVERSRGEIERQMAQVGRRSADIKDGANLQKLKDQWKSLRGELEKTGLSWAQTQGRVNKVMKETGASFDNNRIKTLRQKNAIDDLEQSYKKLSASLGKLDTIKRRMDQATGADKARLQDEGAVLADEAKGHQADVQRKIETVNEYKLDKGSFDRVIAMRNVAGRPIQVPVHIDSSAGERAFKSLGNGLSRLNDHFSGSSNNIAAFDNLIRGLATFLIAGFLQPLIMAAGAAGGALLALGSSAAFAGASLGGALVAGIAQALPMLGIIFAVVQRLSAVFKAVQQATLVQQQGFGKGSKEAKQNADATDQVTAANEALTKAHERVREAQKQLSEARKDAKRQLEDLIMAEKRAQLAAQQAVLSQGEAQDSLRQALQQGQTGEIASRRLDVQSAKLDVEDTRTDARRATVDANKGRAGGIEGMEGVVAAKKQLKEANQAVIEADRSLKKAGRSAAEAASGATAAAGKMGFLTSQLSGPEKRLMKAIQELQKAWRKAAQTMTAPMINAFTHMAGRITDIIKMPRVLSAMKGLATSMAGSLKQVFNAFTSNRAINDWIKLIKQARESLKPLTQIAINLGRTFMGIGVAAGPALKMLLDWIAKLTKGWATFTSSTKGRNMMAEFFKEGVNHAKAWLRLGGSIVKLFFAIAGKGGGAETGLKFVEGATKGIDKLTKNINSGGSAMRWFRNFFETTKKVIKELEPVFTSLGKEFDKTFNKEGVSSTRGFAQILSKVLIPAFGDFVRFVGRALASLGKFLDKNPEVAKFAKQAIAMALAFGFFAKLGGLLGPVISVISKIGLVIFNAAKFIAPMAQRFMAMVRSAGSLRAVFVGLGGPVAAVVGIVLILLAKFKLLDDVWRIMKNSFKNLIEPMKKPFKELMVSVKELFKSFEGEGGLIGILKKVMEFSVRLGGVFMNVWSKGMGQALGGVIKVLSGVIKMITGLLLLFSDPKKGIQKFWDGLKTMVSGVGKIFAGVVVAALAPLATLGQAIIDILTWPFKQLLKFLGISSPSKWFKKLGESLVDGLKAAFRAILGVLTAPFTKGWKWIKDKFDDIKDFFALGIRVWGTIFSRVDDKIKSPFRKAWKWVKDKFGDIKDYFAKGIRGWGIIFSKAFNKLKDSGKDVYEWAKKLPGKFKSVAEDLVKGFVGAWKGVGKKILEILGGVAGFAKGIVKGIAKTIDEALPNKFGPIDIPNNPLKDHGKLYQQGGPIGQGYGGGDRIPILGEAGEFMIRKEAVKFWGRDMIEYLNRMGGAAGKRAPRMSEGGFVMLQGGGDPGDAKAPQRKGAKTQVDTEDIKGGLATVMSLLKRFGKNATKEWRETWSDMDAITRRILGRIEKRVGTDLRQVVGVFRRQGTVLVRAMQSTMGEVGDTVYSGLSYVQEATAKALESFQVKAPKFDVPRPKGLGKGKAIGGFIGQPGERGKDGGGFVPVGRGEAVLNWGQQMAVNARMRGQDTLQSVLGMTRGYHAGGMEQPGYAGGFAGRSPSGNKTVAIPAQYGQDQEFVAAKVLHQAIALAKRFKMMITDAFATSGHSGAGHLQTGTAIDVVPGTGGNWDQVDAAVAFARKKGLTVLYNGHFGHGRGHHAHIELDASKKGLGSGSFIDSIPKIKVKGTEGPMKDMVMNAINRVRKAAQSKIDKEAAKQGAEGGGHMGETSASQMGIAKIINKTLRKLRAPPIIALAAFETALVESGLKNYKVAADHDSLGVYQQRPSMGWGTPKQITNVEYAASTFIKRAMQKLPWKGSAGTLSQSVQRSAFPEKYDQRRAEAMGWIKRTGGYPGLVRGYAKGGQIPGGEGAPTPIMAHAGEWILNRGQQAKLSNAMGASLNSVREMLGFKDGKMQSFAEGGEVGDEPTRRRARRVGASIANEIIEGAHSAKAKSWGDRHIGKSWGDRHIGQPSIGEQMANALRPRGSSSGHSHSGGSSGGGSSGGSATSGGSSKPKTSPEDILIKWKDIDRWGEKARKEGIEAGVYELPKLVMYSFQAVMREIRRAMKAQDILRKGLVASWSKLADTYNVMTKEGGLFDQAIAQLEKFTNTINTRIARNLFRVTTVAGLGPSFGNPASTVVRRTTPEEEARQTLVGLQRTGSRLTDMTGRLRGGQRMALTRRMRLRERVQAAQEERGSSAHTPESDGRYERLLKQLKKVDNEIMKGLDKTDRRHFGKLVRAQRALVKRNDGIKGMQEKLEKMKDDKKLDKDEKKAIKRLEDDIAEAQKGYGNAADRVAKWEKKLIGTLGQTARRVEKDIRRVRKRLRELEKGGIKRKEMDEYKDLKKAFEDLLAQRQNLKDRRQTLDQQMAENLAARFEAQTAVIDKMVENAGKPVAQAESNKSLQAALGNARTQAGFAASRLHLDALKNQRKALWKAFAAAKAIGNKEKMDEILQSIRDMNTTIAEGVANLVREQMEAASEAFTQANTRLDFRDRVAQVVQGLSGTGGAERAQRMRTSVLQGRRAALSSQRGNLIALRDDAQRTGNREVMRDLNNAITENGVALKENTLALKDSVTATRQARIDQITNRGQFRGGVLGSLSTLFQSIATVTGIETPAQQANILTRTGTEIRGTGKGLRSELRSGFGVNLEGLTGEAFANKVMDYLNNFDKITKGYTEAQKTQFEGLLNGVLENENALWANTQALEDLNGNLKGPQSFSSSAWSWFRQAIFTGMGDVLPQYAPPPGMQTGGFVTQGGIFDLHPGEFVINPNETGGQQMPGGDINIEVNEAGQPLDVTHLASRIAFAKKNGQ